MGQSTVVHMTAGTAGTGATSEQIALRALRRSDLPEAVELWARAFGMEIVDADARARVTDRLAFGLRTDREGSFVARLGDSVVGLAQALRRERLWVLSSLAVARRARGLGVGRALLERALAYADAEVRLVVSSNDPAALALYAGAGLELRRTVQASGVPLPSARAGAREFRHGRVADVEALADISRRIRGAAHTLEIRNALEHSDAQLLIGEGAFSVVRPGQGVWLLAALEEAEAAALLVASLALAGRCVRPIVRWVTEDQHWAIEVLERAGLRISRYGALCVGGDPGPLRPFIPSGAFA
jgi:ribosomal protein S18 acetylase RimI-like enzyme